jgi:hypothetical protein
MPYLCHVAVFLCLQSLHDLLVARRQRVTLSTQRPHHSLQSNTHILMSYFYLLLSGCILQRPHHSLQSTKPQHIISFDQNQSSCEVQNNLKKKGSKGAQ